MKAVRTILFASALAVVAAGSATAQIGPGPFAAFPTADPIDARFLGFSCAGLATFEEPVSIGLEVPPGTPSFTVSVFDGDSGKPDGAGKPHWDLGAHQIVVRLYADRLREGSTAAADEIGVWFGNSANPLSGGLWAASAASMPDNDWWGVTVSTSAAAQAPSGNYLYNLTIDLDGACAPGEQVESNLKVAASNPMTFLVPRFGLVGGMRQLFNDGPIVYPGGFPPADFLTAPTTYDGTFTFRFMVPQGSPDLKIFDGDFDFGTGNLVTVPSALMLAPCGDTDDPDTVASYAGVPFDTSGANPEGATVGGVPRDDSPFDLFRCGELDDPDRMGCVRYEVEDPLGNVYANDNPSGDREWEQFRIATDQADDPFNSDYLVAGDTLPPGIWTVNIIGLDLANLNLWFADTCATRIQNGVPVAACPTGTVYLVGDTVWFDADGDGIQDPGEPGIAGVVVHLVDSSNTVVATMETGDSSSPDWPACVFNNTGLDEQGLYCFGIGAPGQFTAVIAPENFSPGGPLAGLTSTTGGEAQTDTLVDDNILTYDFSYEPPPGAPGTGTIGFWKNHPEAWPVDSITVGGVVYSRSAAIAVMQTPGKGDKTYDLFSQLVAAKLNVLIGNESSCIAATIAAADAWLAAHPVGSNVRANDAAWKNEAGALHQTLNDYNNGLLCAPHRD